MSMRVEAWVHGRHGRLCGSDYPSRSPVIQARIRDREPAQARTARRWTDVLPLHVQCGPVTDLSGRSWQMPPKRAFSGDARAKHSRANWSSKTSVNLPCYKPVPATRPTSWLMMALPTFHPLPPPFVPQLPALSTSSTLTASGCACVEGANQKGAAALRT